MDGYLYALVMGKGEREGRVLADLEIGARMTTLPTEVGQAVGSRLHVGR